jgi:hypothetical protein
MTDRPLSELTAARDAVLAGISTAEQGIQAALDALRGARQVIEDGFPEDGTLGALRALGAVTAGTAQGLAKIIPPAVEGLGISSRRVADALHVSHPTVRRRWLDT